MVILFEFTFAPLTVNKYQPVSGPINVPPKVLIYQCLSSKYNGLIQHHYLITCNVHPIYDNISEVMHRECNHYHASSPDKS